MDATNAPFDALLEDLAARRVKARLGGGAAKLQAPRRAGRLTARERIERLVDPGTFVEVGLLAHSDAPGAMDRSWSDGLVTGVAKVGGRVVAVEATDRTVFAGTEGTVFVRKLLALHELAVKRGLPIFNLAEGGGLRMPDGMGAEGISGKPQPRVHLTHDRQTPFLTAILGHSFGMPTWQAVVSDFVVQLTGACMATAGPRMLEVATGERVSEEDLGGVKVHAEVTGQVDAVAETEDDCLSLLRTMFSYLPANAGLPPPAAAPTDDPERPVDEVLRIVPAERSRGYDMKRVIEILVDQGSFFELKRDFGRALVTGLARLTGRVIGVVANNPLRNGGVAGPEECDKATEFTVLCDSYHVPMVYLQDVPGFAVGSRAERQRAPTRIMVWKQANAHATVPRMSVIVRKAIGAAYGAMMGAAQGADFIVAWPTAEINFTGAEVGINVVYHREVQEAADPAEARRQLAQRWDHDSSAYTAAGAFLIDDVIHPRETRQRLCRWIETVYAYGEPRSQRRLASWPTGY